MKTKLTFCVYVLLFSILFILPSCGSGTAKGNMGAAEILLQLKALAEGEELHSQDEFHLDLKHFDVQFSAIHLGNRFFTQTEAGEFFADLADGNPVEVLDIEELPGVEYGEFTLTLGLFAGEEEHEEDHEEEGEEHDHEHDIKFTSEAESEEEHEADHEEQHEAEDYSVLLELEATQNGQSCKVELVANLMGANILVNTQDQSLTVERDATAVLPILFNQESFFENLIIGEGCTDGATLHLEFSPELTEIFLHSFELGEVDEAESDANDGDGHGHSHG